MLSFKQQYHEYQYTKCQSIHTKVVVYDILHITIEVWRKNYLSFERKLISKVAMSKT